MDTKTPLCDKYRTTKDYTDYVPLWVAEELETANGVLKAENVRLRAALTKHVPELIRHTHFSGGAGAVAHNKAMDALRATLKGVKP